jgi:hypothetical protein
MCKIYICGLCGSKHYFHFLLELHIALKHPDFKGQKEDGTPIFVPAKKRSDLK